jgi:hypothetical protein
MTKSEEGLAAANTREWSTYWYWRDKAAGEWRNASNVLQAAGVQIAELVSRSEREQPPDCEAKLDGCWSGIEMTELVDRPTLKRNIKAIRERAAGKEPKRPEALFVWDRSSLLSALAARIDRKERSWQGGPYQRHVLIMCTNEFFLDRVSVDHFLQGATFQTSFLTDVFLGLSYQEGCVPVFHFAVSDGSGALKLQPYLFVRRYDVYAFAAPMIEEYPSKDSMIQLILKRANTSRLSGQWRDDDHDVLADGVVVGRIFKAHAAPIGTSWMWTLAYEQHEDRTPTHGYEPTCAGAMAAFAKSWRRE